MAGADWSYAVQSVQRIEPDPADEDGRHCFAVEFEITGPNTSVSMDIYLDGVSDEAQIITLAMHHMHKAFETLTRVTADRLIPPVREVPH